MVRRLTNPLWSDTPPLGTLMSAASRRLAAELDAGILAAGFADLRAAHAPVFQVIEPEGTRASVLAQRTGMTKQAMGELVRYLQNHGYVTVEQDPEDGRARLVRLTDRGWEVVEAGAAIIARFDALLDEALGAEEVSRLRRLLQAIITGTGSTFSSQDKPPAMVMFGDP